MDNITRTIVSLACCLSTTVLSSPPYGGEKHHYDKSAVAPELRTKQVQLAQGTAECVRTAWIGDVNHRTIICVEWRMVSKEGK